MSTIKKTIKKVIQKPEIVEETNTVPFQCGACGMTGLNRITRDICSECEGTPERL